MVSMPLPRTNTYVSVSDLSRGGTSEAIDRAQDGPVFVLSRNRPVAVLLGVDAYEALLDRLEDLEDGCTGLDRLARWDGAGDGPVVFLPEAEREFGALEAGARALLRDDLAGALSDPGRGSVALPSGLRKLGFARFGVRVVYRPAEGRDGRAVVLAVRPYGGARYAVPPRRV